MNNFSKLLMFCFCIIFSNSCVEKKETYIVIGTKIDSTNLSHWGKGYYKTIIHYSFIYENKSYESSYKAKTLTRAYNYFYSKGDSILISFPKSKPYDSKVLKKVTF
jgi:hypothetical protein